MSKPAIDMLAFQPECIDDLLVREPATVIDLKDYIKNKPINILSSVEKNIPVQYLGQKDLILALAAHMLAMQKPLQNLKYQMSTVRVKDRYSNDYRSQNDIGCCNAVKYFSLTDDYLNLVRQPRDVNRLCSDTGFSTILLKMFEMFCNDSSLPHFMRQVPSNIAPNPDAFVAMHYFIRSDTFPYKAYSVIKGHCGKSCHAGPICVPAREFHQNYEY